MAKKHKNLDNILIQWDGDLSKPSDGSAQSTPDNTNIVWGGYVPCWYPDNHANCVIADMYFEDFDISGGVDPDVPDGIININDVSRWPYYDRIDIAMECVGIASGTIPLPDKAPRKTYTWGDVSFVIEIADGLGTGSRRAREARLHKFDKYTKKRLIHLICRVKGEKVYDDYTEVGKIEVKVEDVEMVTENIMGKVKLEIKSGL